MSPAPAPLAYRPKNRAPGDVAGVKPENDRPLRIRREEVRMVLEGLVRTEVAPLPFRQATE